MKRVFIAVPSYTGTPSKEFRRSLKYALIQLGQQDVDWRFEILIGQCYICQARNILAAHFLASDCTDLLFLDDDLVFPPDAFTRLRDTTPLVVGAIYRKKGEPEQWPVQLQTPFRVDSEGLAECVMLPTGMMRINRSAFEALAPHAPEYESTERGRLRAYFMTGIRNGHFWGEDVAFSYAYRATGGKVHALLDMELGHRNKDGRVYRGNFARYLSDEIKRAA